MSNDFTSTSAILHACELGESSESVTFCAGSVIFQEGDFGDCAYLVESGEVGVVRERGGERRELARLGPGELIGEMAPIDGLRRSATALAVTETRLAPIPRQSIEALVEGADPMLRLLVRLLMHRLRDQGTPASADDAEAVTRGAADVAAALETVREQALEGLRMRKALSDALARRELQLYYQPVVDTREWRTCGFEALMRWVHPEEGFISPGRFIPVVEESELVHPIGQWCLRSASELLEGLSSRHPGTIADGFFVSVNVSPQQLITLDHVDRLLGVVRDGGFDASRVKIEITERLLIDDPDAAVRGLKRIRDAGMSVAIDDFGVGYSSLSYLHRFPLDTLKLDRSFIDHLSESHERRSVVEAIVRLAASLGMDVVAEGVERVEDLGTLEALGVSRIQGFLLGRPMPVDKLREWSLPEDRPTAGGGMRRVA